MRNKSDAIIYNKNFLVMIKIQFQNNVKIFWSDIGGEFLNDIFRSLFQQLCIVHQTSCSFIR